MAESAKSTFNARNFLAKVGDGKAIIKFAKNRNVFTQGEAADTVFYIQSGKVKLSVISEHNKEAVVGILGPGQFFGEGCLNGHPLRIATTTTLEPCVITSITKKAMKAVLHDQPKFSALFVTFLLARNGRMEEDLIDQLFNSSERRLARVLLLLSQFGKEGTPQLIQSEHQSDNIGGYDRHDQVPRQPLHEQVPQTWTHHLQRAHRGQ
jgi:CRP/FNR family cyclic AMP-dependent transcriptional regulator